MRYAAVALALFALPLLRADVCRDIAPNSDRSSFLDEPHPFTFVLPVKPDGPAFRITIRPFPPWWWVYEPASRKFVQSELARELSELKSNGINFDATNHEISTHELLFGCGPLGDRYRVERGLLVKIHLEDAQPNENGCRVTVSDLVGGNMRLTEVRLYDREGNRVK